MPFDVQTSFVLVGAVAVAAAFAWRRYNAGLLFPMSPLSGRAARGLPHTPAGAAASALFDAASRVIADINAEAKAKFELEGPTSGSKSPFQKKPKVIKFLPPFDSRVVQAAISELESRKDAPDAVAAIKLLNRAEADFAKLVEGRRATSFSDSPADVALLEQLWSNTVGGDFERTSEKWGELGFQGIDPQTDLRGGGMLSLDHFCVFAQSDTDSLRRMMTFNKAAHDSKDSSWFLPAVVSIQFTTQLALGEIQLLPAHLAFVLEDAAGVSRGLQRLHAVLLRHFFAVWQDKKPHVMEFTQFVGPNVLDTFLRPDWQNTDDSWNARS